MNDKLIYFFSRLNLILIKEKLYLASFFSLLGLMTSCSDLIKVDPPFTSINKDNVFTKDASATAVLTDIFAQLSSSNLGQVRSISSLYLYCGLAADELTLYDKNNSGFGMFYYNAMTENTDIGFWSDTYSIIYKANAAIEGLSSNSTLSSGVRQQLLGEAKFIRAFCYFYLVNLYGDVPLCINTDALKNATLSRSKISLVYSQITDDLKDAEQLLSEDFRSGNVLNNTSERVRPTKWAAKALLARVYLYNGNYEMAESTASEVIQMNSLFNIDSLDGVFLKNSNECIWQLQDVNNTQGNTGEGNVFILPETGPDNANYPVYLSRFLISSFEDGDQRKVHWVDSVRITVLDSNFVYYYPYKYKSGALTQAGSITEYEMVLRLGEQFLIRSEARTLLGNISGAKEDLNVIRWRAGLGETVANNKDQLINAILHERQVELFTEWGHRWLDLKRTNTIDQVMTVVALDKGSTWNSNWALWPISLSELQSNPNLVQNEGY